MATSAWCLNKPESMLPEIKILREKNEILQSLNTDITTKHKEFVFKYENLETKHNITTEKLQQQLTSKYESQIHALTSQLTTLQNYKALQIEHNILQQEITNLRTKNNFLHSKIHSQQHSITNLQRTHNDTLIELQSQLSEYKLSFNTQSIVIDELKQQLDIELNSSQRRRHSSSTNVNKELNRTFRIHFNDQSTSAHNLHVSSPPRLSSTSTSALSVEFCFVDKRGASELSITSASLPHDSALKSNHII